MVTISRLATSLLLSTSVLITEPANATDGVLSKEAAEGTFKAPPFSPYANRSIPERRLWGDSHLHTGLSLDAGAFGNTLLPDEAWRFAKGEQVISSTGQPVRLPPSRLDGTDGSHRSDGVRP